MERLENWLATVEEVLTAVATVVMVALVSIQVVCRYVLHVSLQGTEEAARFLMIAATFLGAAAAVKRRMHIKIELRHLLGVSPRTMTVWNLLTDAIGLGALGLLVFFVYPTVVGTSERSTALGVPMSVPLGIVLVGGLLMMVHYLFRIMEGVAGLRTPTEGRPDE